MIDLYYAPTGNGLRALFALEESGLAFNRHPLSLQAGDHKKPEFLAMNPAGRIPVIIDRDGPGGKPLTLSQSGAIAMYVAEKSGTLLPTDPAQRAAALQWLFSACSDAAGASMGMFVLSSKPEAAEVFQRSLAGQFKLWDGQLATREWIAGEYSIADISFFAVYNGRKAAVDPEGQYANLARWGAAIAARPGIARALKPGA
jgi:glutathione S-transferase